MNIESGVSLRDLRESLGLSQAKLAEISGIPQHLLSSFELGKTELETYDLKKLKSAISNTSQISHVVERKKRYRSHTYATVTHDPKRIAKYKKSGENASYVSLINSHIDHTKKMRGLSALSLFAGCGGLSLGFDQAGFDIKGFLEIDPSLRSIYRENFTNSYEVGTDITKLSDADIARCVSLIGKVDAIIGGPPCQGFSLAGKRDVHDPRNSLFRHYLRFVDAFEPRVAVMENVRLLTSMKSPKGGFVRDEIQKEFQSRGYKIKLFEVNAKDYGVPQHRERVFFVATKGSNKLNPSFPDRTHGEIVSGDLFGGLRPYRTFADACSDLPFLESGDTSEDPLHAAVSHPQHVIDWLWDVKEGFSAHDNIDPDKRPPSGYNTTYKRQIWLEPAGTVQTTFGMISGCRNVHPIATRSLTIREAARLQSFPDSYKFTGTLGAARTGIGNAVPPLLAYQLAVHLSELL